MNSDTVNRWHCGSGFSFHNVIIPPHISLRGTKRNSGNRPRVWNLKLQSTRIFKTALGISLITYHNMNFPLSMLIVLPFFLYFHLILNERRYVLVEKIHFTREKCLNSLTCGVAKEDRIEGKNRVKKKRRIIPFHFQFACGLVNRTT